MDLVHFHLLSAFLRRKYQMLLNPYQMSHLLQQQIKLAFLGFSQALMEDQK